LPITLDSGANINCIRYGVVKNLKIIETRNNIQLSGADHTPLKLVGQAFIMIKII